MLHEMKRSLDSIRANGMDTAQFVRQWRAHGEELLSSLPERYGKVLDDLLVRLESSGLFSQESCSFSRTDLLDNLELWLTKAGQYLDRKDEST